ncbi:MAG: hypothetical protein ABEI52_11635 [Halobacteriaceae archaeon]
MGKNTSLRIDTADLEDAADMVARDKADTQSEALKLFIKAGKTQYGYHAGENGETALKRTSKELARLLGYVGVGWLVFFWAYPVGFALPGVMILFSALGMVGVYFILERTEPKVSEALFGRGERA